MQVTNTTEFCHGTTQLKVEISNTKDHFAWRMSVNGEFSRWVTHYTGILLHKKFALATDYWDGEFTPWVPFKIDYSVEQK